MKKQPQRKTMFCPMMSPIQDASRLCIWEKCAWWDGEKCAVLGLNESLFYLIKTKEGKK